jgi:hypothetical protein
MFPVPPGDRRWLAYYERIIKELDAPSDPDNHTAQSSIAIDPKNNADVVIVSIPVQPAQGFRDA